MSSQPSNFWKSSKRPLPGASNNHRLQKFATGSVELNIKAQLHVRDTAHYVSTLAAGVGSGALSSVICAPLDLIRTRMQVWGDVMKDTTPAQAFRDLIAKEGWKGMFRGLGATLVTVPLFWGVYFPLYDETKFYVTKHYSDALHPSVIHCGSAVFTGAIADVICNPLFVVRTRLQTQALHQLAEQSDLKKTGMVQTARQLFQEHGALIFWRGMSANLMGLSHVAVQFPAYEHLKKYARDRRGDGKPETAGELLLASALAKMCASLTTYPHEVLRSRMMDSRALEAPTLRGTFAHIYAQEGLAGFYTGLPITLVRVIPNCCVTFLSYEMLLRWSKETWRNHKESQA